MVHTPSPAPLSAATPFVLLDDARDGGGDARLYRSPSAIITAETLAEVTPALAAMRTALAAGKHLAGWLGYGAGAAFEPRLAGKLAQKAGRLLRFGVFDDVSLVAADAVAALLPDPRGAYALTPQPRIAEHAYAAAFDRVAHYIQAGDVYQANLSIRADVPFLGDPLALYARLRAASLAGWGGVAFEGARWLLSASPELFFTVERGRITTRPMKGTAARGATPDADAAAAEALRADPKERAENLMIVDLLRNDVSRIARPGSVRTPRLFDIETYPTLHTLTSTVTGELDEGRDAIDALAALFPCGSVTGAPKIRAMEVIDEVEADGRAAYTGSLGWLSPDGDAAFNVLIRSLEIDETSRTDDGGTATLGLGSGVVADSTAANEWRECLTKAAFVRPAPPDFVLIETMRRDEGGNIALLDWHLARLERSARSLGFAFAQDGVLSALSGHTGEARVRLTLAHDGTLATEETPLPARPTEPVSVALAPLPVARSDFRLRHKTSDRAFYDDARTASGAFEVLFVDPDGYVTEGSITTLFVERDGMLLTPPLARGLLPGTLRARLIAEGVAREADLTPADLVDGFLIGNAVRGLLRARLA